MLLFVATALAAAPVSLPAGEQAASWVDALARSDLEVGEADRGPRARVVARGVRWQVTVIDSAGLAHQVVVEPAHDEASREDLGVLIRSLLRPSLAVGGLPPLPTVPPPEPPAVPAPEPPPPPLAPVVTSQAGEPTPDPPSTPEPFHPSPPEPAEAVPVVIAEPVPEEPVAPVEPPVDPSELDVPDVLGILTPPPAEAPRRRLETGVWARAGVAAGMRDQAQIAPAAEVAVGPSLGRVRLGVLGAVVAPAAVAVTDGRRVSSVDGLLGAWWGPRTHATLGVAAGWSERTWYEDAGPVLRDGVPLLAVDAGGALPLTGRLHLVPTLRLQQDLAATRIRVDDADVGQLAPTTVTLRIGIEWTSMDPFQEEDAPAP